MYENGYKKLQDSLIDVIAEEQAKLGYMKEPIRLYYPLSSLHHFFESEGDAEAMQESLGIKNIRHCMRMPMAMMVFNGSMPMMQTEASTVSSAGHRRKETTCCLSATLLR